MTNAIGANIKRLREARGYSQARLAHEVCRAAGVIGDPVGRQEVSRWETGKRTPREWLPFIAAALGVSADTLRAPLAPPEPPLPTLADFLPEGDPLSPLQGHSGRRIGMGAVEDLQQRVHGLRLADDVLAGGDLIRPALRELRSAVKLYREGSHTSEVGRQLLRQIGEVAQIAGWIASDAGQHAEAERIYRLGISAARQAEDHTLAGNIAGSLAYQLSNTGREVEGLKLARAAVNETGPDAPPKARALYLDRVAWAHVKAGGIENGQQAMRALGRPGRHSATTAPVRNRPPICIGSTLANCGSWNLASTQSCTGPCAPCHCCGKCSADTTRPIPAKWPCICHGWPLRSLMPMSPRKRQQ